jgi:type III pantothenate kinase
MSVLCLDCGNTRLKWALREGGAWLAQGAPPLTQLDNLTVDAERIVACNVAGARGREAIEALAARLSVTVEWVRARPAQCGVTNGYEQPEQLGADRWAALIGAHSLHVGACLVVNAGTATTVDVLSADGMFRGGLILPGVAMMREALVANTADLPVAAGEYRDLPRNTFDAIASGCVNATVGAIRRMFVQVAGDTGAICLLSGGAAPAIAAHLDLPLRLVDNLVLEGLARVAGEPAAATR